MKKSDAKDQKKSTLKTHFVFFTTNDSWPIKNEEERQKELGKLISEPARKRISEMKFCAFSKK